MELLKVWRKGRLAFFIMCQICLVGCIGTVVDVFLTNTSGRAVRIALDTGLQLISEGQTISIGYEEFNVFTATTEDGYCWHYALPAYFVVHDDPRYQIWRPGPWPFRSPRVYTFLALMPDGQIIAMQRRRPKNDGDTIPVLLPVSTSLVSRIEVGWPGGRSSQPLRQQ